MRDGFQLPRLDLPRCWQLPRPHSRNTDALKNVRSRFGIPGAMERAPSASSLPPGLVIRRTRPASVIERGQFGRKQAWAQPPEACTLKTLAPCCKPLGPRTKPSPRMAKLTHHLPHPESPSPRTASTPSEISSREDCWSLGTGSSPSPDLDTQSFGSRPGSRLEFSPAPSEPKSALGRHRSSPQLADRSRQLPQSAEHPCVRPSCFRTSTITPAQLLNRSSECSGTLGRRRSVGDVEESVEQAPVKQARQRPRPEPVIIPQLRGCLRSAERDSPRSAPSLRRRVSWDSPVGTVVVVTPYAQDRTPMHFQLLSESHDDPLATPISDKMLYEPFPGEMECLQAALLGVSVHSTASESNVVRDDDSDNDTISFVGDSEDEFDDGEDVSRDDDDDSLGEVEEAVECDIGNEQAIDTAGWVPHKSQSLDMCGSLSSTWRKPRRLKIRIGVNEP